VPSSDIFNQIPFTGLRPWSVGNGLTVILRRQNNFGPEVTG